MSQSKIKTSLKVVKPHMTVRFTLAEIRGNSEFGRDGVKDFLEFHANEPEDRIVIVDLETGELRLEDVKAPQVSFEVEPLVN